MRFRSESTLFSQKSSPLVNPALKSHNGYLPIGTEHSEASDEPAFEGPARTRNWLSEHRQPTPGTEHGRHHQSPVPYTRRIPCRMRRLQRPGPCGERSRIRRARDQFLDVDGNLGHKRRKNHRSGENRRGNRYSKKGRSWPENEPYRNLNSGRKKKMKNRITTAGCWRADSATTGSTAERAREVIARLSF